jgi:hypothetical protein
MGLDVDPLEYVEGDDNAKSPIEAQEERKGRLNAAVAVTVAVLATFMGLCQVKAGNVAQAMEQAQSKSNDHWAWYQFRKVRSEVFQATADQMRLARLSQSPAVRGEYDRQAGKYQAQAGEQRAEMKKTQAEAEDFDKRYDALNIHDDQFDLSEAALSIAIALLAVASLTQKRWLFGLAMVPTLFGVAMGLAGLFGWGIHSDFFSRWLGV